MRNYEAMVIVDARLEEGEIQKAVDRFSEAIAAQGGDEIKIDRWGNRRFTYEIDHLKEGYYFVADFKAPDAAIEPLRRLIQISDEYIRGKILQPPVVPGGKIRHDIKTRH